MFGTRKWVRKAARPWRMVILTGFTGFTSAIALAQQQQARSVEVTTRLSLTTEAEDHIAGVFPWDASEVRFSSRMDTASRASLRVELGDLVLEAEGDYENDTRTLDSHGHELSIGERLSLAALSAHLKERLRPDDGDLAPHEDLLLKAVSFWAKAPGSWF